MYGPLCTEFYDLNKPTPPQEELDLYMQLLSGKGLVLEAMCGSGRLLLPLLQKGIAIHGVDNGAAMLASCRARAQAVDIEPVIFEASIETMQLPYTYDAIIIAFGSFQLLYPRTVALAALANLKQHLKQGGILILDLFIPWDAVCAADAEEFQERYVTNAHDETIALKTTLKSNKFEQYFMGTNHYTKKSGSVVMCTEKEQFYLSWYYRYEIELLLNNCGFNTVHVIEHSVHATADTSHMVVIAE